MLQFSSLEVELFYLHAVADYTKHKLAVARAEGKSEQTEQLEKKLQYDLDIVEQFERRLKASH